MLIDSRQLKEPARRTLEKFTGTGSPQSRSPAPPMIRGRGLARYQKVEARPGMTREELDSVGEAIARTEQEERETSRELEVERMALGLVCYECGAEHELPFGRPTLCDPCRGRKASFVEVIEAAERRLERRREQQAAGEQACDVEGCSNDPEAYPDSCCDACLFAYWLRAQIAAAEPLVNPWTTADHRYFAGQRDAELQQQWLREKRQRHADRVGAYVRRRGLSTAEAALFASEFEITDAGRAALREAQLSEQANVETQSAVRNVAPMFGLLQRMAERAP